MKPNEAMNLGRTVIDGTQATTSIDPIIVNNSLVQTDGHIAVDIVLVIRDSDDKTATGS